MDEEDKLIAEINDLITNNDFPLGVVSDVYSRIKDCSEVGYLQQQLRYLKHFKARMDEKK